MMRDANPGYPIQGSAVMLAQIVNACQAAATGLTTGQRRRRLAGMERFILAVVFGAGLAAFGWALFAGMGALAALLFAIVIDIAASAVLLLALWIGACGLHVLVELCDLIDNARRTD